MNNIDHPEVPFVLKVNVPDKGVFEKRFTFGHEEKVWAAKEQVIHEITGKESKDIQNYGFFVPPYQGKAGKFMDEGRPLSEYSLPGEDQSLEFILKRRIYRSINFDENKLTKIHTKTNLKKLIELVEQNNAGQVNQLLERGLDPNFLDAKTGESPLTTAAIMDNATEVIMFLVNGGAYMDFRNRNGLTAVHCAAAAGKGHNIKAFLDLGASPNYRDLKGLTPLYHACLSCRNPHVVELLLSDQSDTGVVDSQEWQEIHQVCRYGYIHHMEQLIYYGANLNAQNGTGNTPLHICSLYNQEDCARLLLYRGARRDIVNFANQTAEMVAVVATNLKLSEFIKNYNEKDVVPYIDKPTYSTRRRAQSKNRPTANSVFLRDSTDTFLFCSESLSTTSSTPSLHSETSEPMSLDLSPRENVPVIQVTQDRSPTRKYKRNRTMSGSGSDSSYASDSGDETGGSAVTSPVHSPTSNELTMRWRTYSLSSLNKEEKGTIPRVKEVKGAANMTNKKSTGKSHSRRMYVAVKNFTPTQGGELSLAEGDIVEVLTKGEKGYWQGSVSEETGWFPAECVEELKKRKHRSKTSLHKPPSIASSLNKSNTSLVEQPPSAPASPTPEPRQVILNKVKAGFGFQMRGANAPTVNKLEFQPSNKIPALQYIGEVEPGGEAEKSGLKKGDYILEVNGNDVRTASHRHVVSLIRKTGHNLIMKVISIDKNEAGDVNSKPPGITRSNSLPTGTTPLLNGTSSHDGLNKEKRPPPIPSRAPTTSLSSRPKSQRHSIADVNFEEPSNPAFLHEDRVISVPRERMSPTDTQWQSPLTGHEPVHKRPESSYGAIIGSTHSPTDGSPKRFNYRPLDYLDNTGFMTLPSKPTSPVARQPISMDDTAINWRKEGSLGGKDRPKSWMPKVLPTGVPSSPPGHPVAKQHSADDLLAKPNETKTSSKEGDGRREKKRRFSFKKKKEKDYTPSVVTAPPKEGPRVEDNDDTDETTAENLHIEDEETRPSSLPGLHHKRLSTFKPVTAPHHRHVENEAVSPELSQALEKRKSRVGSDELHDFPPPPHGYAPPAYNIHPVGRAHPVDHEHNAPAAPTSAPPTKSLEDSIRDEMMRRRANTAPASGIPSKPRRTFEYKRSSDDSITECEGEAPSALDSELAKAIARRAQKMTSEPAKAPPIYENIKSFKEPEEMVEPSPENEPLTIDDKLKKLHLHDEVFLPTRFKAPVQPPPQVKTRPENRPTGKAPPKTLPKPKKKPSSSTEEERTTPRVSLTLPLSQDISHLPPPVLSPEMVATQFLDDVIDEEVKNSNWDTASWKDKDFSTPRTTSDASFPSANAMTQRPPSPLATPSPPLATPSPPLATHSPTPIHTHPDFSAIDGSGAGKKKYVYKITFVTEKPSDGSIPVEHPPVITQIVSNETSTKTRRISTDELPPPPPPPPVECHDESTTSIPSPVFTPPNSPPSTGEAETPLTSLPHPVIEPPTPELPQPLLLDEPPPPVQVQYVPEEPEQVEQEPPPPVQEQPPLPVQEPPLPVQEQPPPPSVSEPVEVPTSEHPPTPVSEPPQPPAHNEPPSHPPPPPVVSTTEPPISQEVSVPSKNKESNEEPVSNITHPNVITDSPVEDENSATSPKVITTVEKPALEELEGSRPPPDQSKSVADGPENVSQTTEINSSPGTDVPAPPGGIVDQNENFMEAPAIHSGDVKELAPAEPKDVPTKSSRFRDIPYVKWSCVHVCQWLDSIGMAEHSELFQANDIRGPNLVGLTKEDLRELGVKKLGHRMTIADEVQTLTTKNSDDVKL